MAKAAASAADKEVSHNLLGQRLGRKGRDTRERILAATERLLAGPAETAISLSAVAREASLAMTTLYLYFSDLTELLLAVLVAIMASAEQSYVGQLKTRWPDETLDEHCLRFVEAYHAFWEQHARILHLRNSFADGGDERMRKHRIEVSEPVIALLVRQMDADPKTASPATLAMGSVLLTGVERLVTVATDIHFPGRALKDPNAQVHALLNAEAKILYLGIKEARAHRGA